VEPTRYRITVQGRLTERLKTAFEGLALEPGGERTVLVGEIRDQAHLYGVLDRVCNLGLELVSVEEDSGECRVRARRDDDPVAGALGGVHGEAGARDC